MRNLFQILGSLRGGVVFWIRWGVAAASVILQRFCLARTMEASDVVAVFLPSASGVVLLVVAAVLITPEILWAILWVFEGILASVFLPSEKMVPPLDYRVARMYAAQRRFEEAVERYEFLTHYHPQATDAYLEGIEAAFHGGFEDAARAFFQRAMDRLKDGSQRALVRKRFEDARAESGPG